MARILILGAGFAGLWAAIGAARKRDEAGHRAAEVEITVVDRNPYHNIRVRNYEVDITDATIPLAKLLDPVGVKHVVASVEAIDTASQDVMVAIAPGRAPIGAGGGPSATIGWCWRLAASWCARPSRASRKTVLTSTPMRPRKSSTRIWLPCANGPLRQDATPPSSSGRALPRS